MISQLSNNPFRMLGVCSNAPIRDIVANKDKMNAFLKVGKESTFPLDLVVQLGELQRTPENIAAADSQLTIEGDRLLAAQFWFIRMTPTDDEAFTQLSANNIDNAIEIWSREENLSSLQNRAICHLMNNDISSACHCFAVLYSRFREEFVAAIGIRSEMAEVQLMDNLLVSVVKSNPGIDCSMLLDAECPELWNSRVKHKKVDQLVERLDDAIAMSLQRRKSGDKLAAGRKLIRSATEIIADIKSIEPKDDSHFFDVLDKVFSEVEECCNEYVKHSTTLSAYYEAYELFEETRNISDSPYAEAEYNKFCSYIKDMIGSLPPAEVKEEHKEFLAAHEKYFAEINDIDDVGTMINNLEKRLDAIRQKIGEDNLYYVKLSSIVVKDAMNELTNQFIKALDTDDLSAFAKYVHKEEVQEKMVSAIRTAWRLAGRIGKFTMDEETLEWYNKSKDSYDEVYFELKNKEKKERPLAIIIYIVVAVILLYGLFIYLSELSRSM